MYVGGTSTGERGNQVGTMFRCVGTACGAGVVLPGMAGAPRITVAPSAGGDVVWAIQGDKAYRSLDAGASFQRVELPPGTVGILAENADATGRLHVVTMSLEPGRGALWSIEPTGSSWAQTPDATLPAGNIMTVKPLADGTLLVGLNGPVAGIACSHDGGASWAPAC
jgi:hypothetical protein